MGRAEIAGVGRERAFIRMREPGAKVPGQTAPTPKLRVFALRKLFQRFCIIEDGKPYRPFLGYCFSRAHRHVNRERAMALIASEQYRQGWGLLTLPNGQDKDVEIPAIERVGRLTWRKRMSRGAGPPVAVMQLVP